MTQFPAAGLKIVAPVNTPADVQLLYEAGASELYCGVLPQSWIDVYGSSDRLNKRQGRAANLSGLDDLYAIQENARRFGMPVALALNTAYTPEMLPAVLEIAATWAAAGGDAIMVSDPALMMAMQRRHPAVKCHLSILANPFNSKAIQFYRRFGAARVVLPRELEIAEMRALARRCPGTEFEVMVFNDKCHFIDGLCNFYHATVYQPGVRTGFQYEIQAGVAEAVSFDPGYAGHGCAILCEHPAAPPWMKRVHISGNPGCAACYLPELAAAGITYLKLGGRGLPPERSAQNIRFIKAVVERAAGGDAAPAAIRALYRAAYQHDCTPGMCYYSGQVYHR